MKEPGVFKTRLFGGFDKKDVFEYFESIKADGDEESALRAENERLQCELDKKDNEVKSLKAKILELDEKIDAHKKLSMDCDDLNKKIASLEHELFDTSNRLDNALSYQARCDTLSHKIVKMQSELMLAKTSAEKETEKNTRIAAVLKSMPETADCVVKMTELLAVLGETAESIETIGAIVNTVKKELD